MAAIPLGMANMPHCCVHAGIATTFSTPFMQMRYSTPLCVCAAAVFAALAMAMSTHLGVPNEESTNGETRKLLLSSCVCLIPPAIFHSAFS